MNGTKDFMKTKTSESETAPAVYMHRVVRRWWVIECVEDDGKHEIGPAHNTLEKAEWYVANCVRPKRRARKYRIVRHEEHAWMEAPNDSSSPTP